jgi:ribosome-associated protein
MPKPLSKRPARARSQPDSLGVVPAKPRATQRRSTTGKRSKPKKERPTVTQVVATALDELKALEVTHLDVRHLTTVTDAMVIASGRSDRHVRAIAGAIVEQCKKAGYRPIGVEGEKSGEWVLVDLADIVVHVMLPRVRDFYNLEKLWDMPARDEVAEAGA